MAKHRHSKVSGLPNWLADCQVWLQGRHGVWALTVCLVGLALALLAVALGKGDPQRWLIYGDQVCIPDPASRGKPLPKLPAGVTFVGCKPGTRELGLVVPLAEVTLVIAVAVAVVLLMPALPDWERFASRRLSLYIGVAVGLAMALPVGGFAWLGKMVAKQGLRSQVGVICLDALIGIALMLIAMALLGRFLGLGLGLGLFVVNLLMQKAQARTGFALRFYDVHNVKGMVPFSVTVAVLAVLLVVGVVALSATCGRSMHFDD